MEDSQRFSEPEVEEDSYIVTHNPHSRTVVLQTEPNDKDQIPSALTNDDDECVGPESEHRVDSPTYDLEPSQINNSQLCSQHEESNSRILSRMSPAVRETYLKYLSERDLVKSPSPVKSLRQSEYERDFEQSFETRSEVDSVEYLPLKENKQTMSITRPSTEFMQVTSGDTFHLTRPTAYTNTNVMSASQVIVTRPITVTSVISPRVIRHVDASGAHRAETHATFSKPAPFWPSEEQRTRVTRNLFFAPGEEGSRHPGRTGIQLPLNGVTTVGDQPPTTNSVITTWLKQNPQATFREHDRQTRSTYTNLFPQVELFSPFHDIEPMTREVKYAECTGVGYVTKDADGNQTHKYFEPVGHDGSALTEGHSVHSAVPDQGRVDPLLGGGKRGESQVHLSNYPREIAHQPDPPNFYDRAGAAPRFHAHPLTTRDAQSLSRGKPVATARAPDFVIFCLSKS